MKRRFLLKTLVTLLFCLLWPVVSRSAAVVIITHGSELGNWEKQLNLACRFYGVDIRALTIGDREEATATVASLRDKSVVAVIASEKALPFLDKTATFAALRRLDGDAVPIMILGLTASADTNILKRWSADALVAIVGSENISADGYYKIADVKSLAHELSGQNFSFSGGSSFGLSLAPSPFSQAIILIHSGTHDLPVLTRTRTGRQDVFFQAAYSPAVSHNRNVLEVFPSVAPILIFIRYASGERAWHSVGHYANLTIDDPWLTEPYGNLSYQGLLQQMQKVNFHTTIGFIPWNFDRSRPNVISLFKEHPDRYSISIHGDNHDHQEFYDYQHVSLSDQAGAVRQAIARMETFKTLTGLPYDKVMVWPHEILAPTPTLTVLKEYNFLGNVVSDAVPLGSDKPSDLMFLLRSGNLVFSNFPTVERTSLADGSLQARIAVNAFLENPILLWRDQDLFASGIDAFNETATFVNHIQPDTAWVSLGNIMRHLFLIKLREDGDYDLMAFSSQITLTNSQEHGVKFFVKKDESFGTAIRSLTVGNKSYPYKRLADSIALEVAVPAKASREIVISYENDLDVSRVDVSKTSFRVNLLRKISDFRDIKLSPNAFGAAAIRFYYDNLFSEELSIEQLLVEIFSVFFAVAIFLIIWKFARKAAKARRT